MKKSASKAATKAVKKVARKPARPSFTLTSPDFRAGGSLGMEQVYGGFGCTGQNISPALAWSGAPAGTRSFALLVHDPDAPTGGAGWWHWLVLNIPASATGLPKNAGAADGANLPAGAVQVATDFGSPGWGGPCPPAGDKAHRYVFTLYALSVERLDVAGGSASLAGYMVNGNCLAKATRIGKFARKK
ncbi:MAG: YbhB/YbcL family Raf kinase inhibitor-like protein [Burkholderiales bacterium]|nr:YbhB/YbcL family Raf kinase inhibitor-like protein [Burkholderiales bacterium]